MTDTDYIFQLSSYDIGHLLPQVSRALEKRTELVSRKQYPGLWRHTDRLNAVTQRSTQKQEHRKSLCVLCLLLGIFLLVPGLVSPRELFIPLLAGITGVSIGIAGLWQSRKQKKNPFDNSARLLLSGKDSISRAHSLTMSFSDTGMTLPADTGSTVFVPYSDFECAIETTDTFLFVYGERITLLQKQDLTQGSLSDFSSLLSEKVSTYYSI